MFVAQKNFVRNVVLAAWISETCIEFLCGKGYRSAGEESGSCASKKMQLERIKGREEQELSW